MLLVACLTLAFGGEPTYYHPDDATGASALFRKAGEQAGTALEHAESDSAALEAALDDYELALHALGDRAGTKEHDRYFLLAARYRTELAEMQTFVGKLSDDMTTAFEQAFGRAVAAYPDAVECARTVTGPTMPGLPVHPKPNPDCVGTDVNDAIGAAMDADPQLVAAMDDVLSRQWPSFTWPDDHGAPIGTGTRTVEVTPLLEAVAKTRLRAIASEDEQARIPIAAALEQGTPASELRDEARAITEKTAGARLALATPILAAAEKVAAKWKEPMAWCASPAALGGCGVDDDTKSLVPRLAADKRVQGAAR